MSFSVVVVQISMYASVKQGVSVHYCASMDPSGPLTRQGRCASLDRKNAG